MTDLPQTFQDAVIITRRLNFRYIWIDSLCIIQDDEADWTRESARMFDVFSGAQLVVVASHARDTSIGCFKERTVPPSVVVRLPVDALLSQQSLSNRELTRFPHVPSTGNTHAMILPFYDWKEGPALWRAGTRDQPLEDRGWTLQEFMLARRVLSYTSDVMLFQCQHGGVGEDGRYGRETRILARQRPNKPVANRNPRAPDGSMHLDANEKNDQNKKDDEDEAETSHIVAENFIMWFRRVATSYSRRRLTKSSDRLPALSGLARYFHARITFPYFVGMWLVPGGFIRSLCWTAAHKSYEADDDDNDDKVASHGPKSYPVPSWSWLKAERGVDWNYRWNGEDIAKVVDMAVKPKAAENPFGEITDAWICLRAPSARLVPRLGAASENTAWNCPSSYGELDHPRNMRVHVLTGEVEGGCDARNDLHVEFDHKATRDSGDWSMADLRVLLLYKGAFQGMPQYEPSVFGLVVTSLNDPKYPGRMKRIGYLEKPVGEVSARKTRRNLAGAGYPTDAEQDWPTPAIFQEESWQTGGILGGEEDWETFVL